MDLTPLSLESLGGHLAEAALTSPNARLVREYFEGLVADMPNGADSDYEAAD